MNRRRRRLAKTRRRNARFARGQLSKGEFWGLCGTPLNFWLNAVHPGWHERWEIAWYPRSAAWHKEQRLRARLKADWGRNRPSRAFDKAMA